MQIAPFTMTRCYWVLVDFFVQCEKEYECQHMASGSPNQPDAFNQHQNVAEQIPSFSSAARK